MKNRMPIRSRATLIGLTCAAFVFNTSEFIPIGLLSDIAADFCITEARAGMLISVYAWVVMLLSLPLMLLVSKMEMKRLVVGVVGLFFVCQVLSGLSVGYDMLMASRIGVACSHSVFWAIVSPMAVRLVDERHRAVALGMIVTGTSVAMIFGLPLGRIIGLHIGWRMTFMSVGAFAFATMVYLMVMLPKMPSRGGFGVHNLPMLLRNPLLVGLYVLSFAVAASYYMGYSYIEPFLMQVAGLRDSLVTVSLMVFGGAGILGSIAFSKYYERNPYRFFSVVLAVIASCLLLMFPLSSGFLSVVALCIFWGMAVTAFNVAMQAEIIHYSPQAATSVSMAIFSGIFNLGIGCGTLAGGVVCTYSSIAYVGFAGGIVAIAASVYWHRYVLRLMRKAEAGAQVVLQAVREKTSGKICR